MIIGIVCVDEKNWGIGCDGKMLFDLKEDLNFFKQKTEANIVVMGHKTFNSLPDKARPLPDRVNIVLCSKGNGKDLPLDVIEYNDIQKLKHDVEVLGSYQDVFICGGSKIYEEFLPLMDRVYVTKVDAEIKTHADTFFPNLDSEEPFTRIVDSEKYGYEIIQSYYFKRNVKESKKARGWEVDRDKSYKISEFTCYDLVYNNIEQFKFKKVKSEE